MTLMMKHFFAATVFLFTATTVLAANITASVSRNPVTLDESFSLILRAEGSVDADPDLSPLRQDFEILGTSQSTSMNFVNGKLSRKSTWRIDLMAKEVGVLTIPPVRFGQDSSPALRVTVKDAGSGGTTPADQTLAIELDTDKQEVWQQAQLVLTIKLLHQGDLRNASLSELRTSDPDAIIEQLGDDKNYEAIRNGVRYGVIERTYAIFPQTSGELTIEPLRFEARLAAPRRSFFDPLGGGQLKRVRSRPLTVKVKPLPAGADAASWLPAEQVLVKQEWSQNPAQLTAGEPVTRTLTLVARGMLASQLPDIRLPETDGVKQYPDKPVLNSKTDGKGVVASKQIKIALIPAYGGNYTLPAIRIPWWNTRTGKAEVATVPATTLVVSGSAKPQNTAAATGNPADTPATVSTDIPAPAPTPAQAASTPLWQWLSLALALGWALTAVAWWFSRRPASAGGTGVSLKRLHRRVLQSCHDNDAPACKSALLDWARARWPQQRIGNLMDIVPLVNQACADAIRALNSRLYSQHSEQWDGSRLAQIMRHDPEKPNHQQQQTELAEPLFRLR